MTHRVECSVLHSVPSRRSQALPSEEKACGVKPPVSEDDMEVRRYLMKAGGDDVCGWLAQRLTGTS
jgi:hypothetical protein